MSLEHAAKALASRGHADSGFVEDVVKIVRGYIASPVVHLPCSNDEMLACAWAHRLIVDGVATQEEIASATTPFVAECAAVFAHASSAGSRLDEVTRLSERTVTRIIAAARARAELRILRRARQTPPIEARLELVRLMDHLYAMHNAEQGVPSIGEVGQ